MKTLAILLHLAVWYGTFLLIVVFLLTATGGMVARGGRKLCDRLRRLTWQHVGQGLALFTIGMMAVIAVAMSQNHGKVPAWLEPPPIASLWSDGVAESESAPNGDRP